MPRSYASSCWNCGEEEVVGGSEAHPVFACSCMAEQVRAWDYRPDRWKPKGVFPKEPLLGVELEVGATRRRNVIAPVSEIDPRCDHLYMKEDGSIEGVEIVTHPMTLAWARNYQFDSLLKRLREESCFVNEDYGLHVHVSRNAFQHKGKQSMSHQMRWLMFLYRNARYLHILARRKNERYASFRALPPGELKRKAQGIVFHDDSRYVAVNCNNERTFELRFFQATLDEDEFWAALEFADASVRYTRNMTSQDIVRGRGATWLDFRDWVLDHDYPCLALDPSITAARTIKWKKRVASPVRALRATNYSWEGLNALPDSQLRQVVLGLHHAGESGWTVPHYEQQMAERIWTTRLLPEPTVDLQPWSLLFDHYLQEQLEEQLDLIISAGALRQLSTGDLLRWMFEHPMPRNISLEQQHRVICSELMRRLCASGDLTWIDHGIGWSCDSNLRWDPYWAALDPDQLDSAMAIFNSDYATVPSFVEGVLTDAENGYSN